MANSENALQLVAAADEVIAELKKSPLPREAAAALAALSAGELGPWTRPFSPFRCLYGFTEWTGSLDHFPDWPGGTDPKTGRPTHAFSPWQFQPDTYSEIAALTGFTSVYPADLISNAWALAVRDYRTLGGGDLLAKLRAGALDKLRAGALDDVAAKLRGTWPGGADGFADRYRAELTLFPQAALTLPLGLQFSCPVRGALKGHPVPVPADALKPTDPSICTAAIAGELAVFTPVKLGRTEVVGADLVIEIESVAPTPDHIELDLAQGRYSMAAATMLRTSAIAAAAAVLLALLAQPAGRGEPGGPGLELARIGSPSFCYGRDQSALAIARCLRWTEGLSRR